MAKNIRYLALGDSYTFGEGVKEQERWSVQLAMLLRKDGFSIETPIVIARSGWTTANLTEALDNQKPTPPFDLVSLLIGTNNQFQGRSQEEYRHDFRQLLKRALHLAQGKATAVLILSLPDWGATPYAEGMDRKKIAQEIDSFNAINRDEAEQAGVTYVDITTHSRMVANDSTMFAADGLHPSGKMYTEWAKMAKTKLKIERQ